MHVLNLLRSLRKLAVVVIHAIFVNIISCRFPPTGNPVVVCHTICVGDEGRLVDCLLDFCGPSNQCPHSDDVGVTCSKYNK